MFFSKNNVDRINFMFLKFYFIPFFIFIEALTNVSSNTLHGSLAPSLNLHTWTVIIK